MKRIKYLFFVLCLFSSCSKSNYDGLYVFDEDAFKAAFATDVTSKDMTPETQQIADQVLTGVLAEFRNFTIELKGAEAVATFRKEVTKATLKPVSSSGSEAVLAMTPVDEAIKNQVANLHISGAKLVLDDGSKESGKLYFIKK
jgi:hypothetical protein